MNRLLRASPLVLVAALFAIAVAVNAPALPGNVLAQTAATPTPPRYLLDVPPYLDGVVTCIPNGATVEMHVLPLNPSQVIVRCVVIAGTPLPTPMDTATNTPLTSTPTATATSAATDTPSPTFTPFVPTLTETPVPQPTDTPKPIDTPTVTVPTSGTPTPTATATLTGTVSSIALTSTLHYQTMLGWQATGLGPVNDVNYATYAPALYNALEDLGINSVRVEVVKLAGQSAFDLTGLDAQMDKAVVAYRTQLASHGKTLVIDICSTGGGFAFKNFGAGNAVAFASAMTALYSHMQTRYGFVPDYFEILEPDTFGYYTNLGSPVGPNTIGDIYARTGEALTAAGFVPNIIATSDSRTDIFLLRFPQLWSDPNHPIDRAQNRANIKLANFHLYDNALDSALANIGALGAADNLPTAMLEHIGSTYNELHRLLKLANLSLYQQYTAAFATTDNGAQYFTISGTTLTIGSRTKLLHQYMAYITPGSVRIGAAGPVTADPLAFIRPDGGYVVVVNATAAGALMIPGLPMGTYGISYSTGSQYNVQLPDVTLAQGDPLGVYMPGVGAMTIYQKNGLSLLAPTIYDVHDNAGN